MTRAARLGIAACLRASLCALVLAAPGIADAAPATPKAAYEAAFNRERALTARPASQRAAPREIRAIVASYERVSRRWPRSGYADNALVRGGTLAARLYARTGTAADKSTAIRLLKAAIDGYPSSSLRGEARTTLRALQAPRRTAPNAPQRARETTILRDEPMTSREVAPAILRTSGTPAAAGAAAEPAPSVSAMTRLLAVDRAVLPGLVRVTLSLDREVPFHEERLGGPDRVFFDLAGTIPADTVRDSMEFASDAVRQVRVGRQPDNATRVVLHLGGPSRYSVFTLYNPFRLVVDVERAMTEGPEAAAPAPLTARRTTAALAQTLPPVSASQPLRNAAETSMAPRVSGRRVGSNVSRAPAAVPASAAVLGAAAPGLPAPLEPTTRTPPAVEVPVPAAPRVNSSGSYSLARQLGLGVARIVIDPGHGGHDPGALGKRINEADLVLDIALRLEKLLANQPGVEPILTRRTDVYVPLEERTAIANRQGADLFLSIHANASRNVQARGVETYFLNFASTPDAEAVAARENATSSKTMHHLPDILKAIALNNKLDESRDLARVVQTSLVRGLKAHNGTLRDLGVKQAPFVVLIGAGMPSVLAEVAFVTHQQEGSLLRTTAYRQQIAEALFKAVMHYQESLKSVSKVARMDEE